MQISRHNLRIAILLTVFFVSSYSHAQDVPSPASSAATAKTPFQQMSCSKFLPASTTEASGQKQVLVAVTITAQGAMRDPTLFKSSGNSSFDQAIVACANGNRLHPISVESKPATVRWILGYQTSPHWSGFLPASPTGQRHICGSRFYPARALRLHAQGDVVLSYKIGSDGKTKDVKVEQSSGNADLDRISTDCVLGFDYFPATQNGQPADLDYHTRVVWRLSFPIP